MFKIALDAGHGLYTPGKRCLKSLDKNETREWVLNSRICEKVEEQLKAYTGYILYRIDDVTGKTDVPLSERTNKANSLDCDFYLSVHHDAGIGGGTGGGMSSIAYTNASEKSKNAQKLIYDEFIKATGLKGNRGMPMPRKNLHVLRETKMPAVLIECGFMDSATDVPIILSDKFAENAAKGIVKALVALGNLKNKGEENMSNFKDIEGNFAQKDIEELFEMGIVNGKTETEFKPNDVAARAEIARMIRNTIRYVTGK